MEIAFFRHLGWNIVASEKFLYLFSFCFSVYVFLSVSALPHDYFPKQLVFLEGVVCFVLFSLFVVTKTD